METIEAYLEALASDAPTPGGGSAATMVGAMAASLVAMVARLTSNNPKFVASAETATALVTEADALRRDFELARLEDECAYGDVVAAMALPRTTGVQKAERTARLQAALADAARAPLGAARLACDALALVVRVERLDNANLVSDVACAAIFARASLSASFHNVAINHAFMNDRELIAAQSSAIAELREDAATSEALLADVLVTP